MASSSLLAIRKVLNKHEGEWIRASDVRKELHNRTAIARIDRAIESETWGTLIMQALGEIKK